MVDELRLNLLGETEIVRRSPASVALGGPRPKAILAFLALRAPSAVGRSEIIEAVYGLRPPRSAVNALQTHVSMLRKVLGADIIETVGDGYRLGGHVRRDVADFAEAVRVGSAMLAEGNAVDARDLLRSALALWRGPALADLGDAAFASSEADRLAELRLVALERRIQADLDHGHSHELVAELESLVAAHPLREMLSAQLMRALYRSGRQGDALAAFESTRRRLAEELGIEPSPALRELHHQLLTQTDPVPPRPSQPSPRPRAAVPAWADRTIGRERELAELTELATADHDRLLTITGPGGVGKTRIAAELGHRLAGRYRDGVAFVSLVEALTAADVAPTICAALGISTRTADVQSTLVDGLRDRELVLICDNFEHVIDAAGLLADLLTAAPGLRIVVTSRRRLDLRGEHSYLLPPLSYLDSDGPAIELFVDRARSWLPPDHADAATIAEICARCDGLPLAIELAAARTQVLSLPELRDRLDPSLPLLTGGRRDAPLRHQTMRASIAESVAGLSAEQQANLASLSVFRGGFTLAGAAAVNALGVPEAAGLLETLLGHSLIRARTTQHGARRFDLLETVREFLDDSLTDAEKTELRRRHGYYTLAAVGPVGDPAWHPYAVASWHSQLTERANIRAAIRWAEAAAEWELFADLVISAGAMWIRLGPRAETGEWLRTIVANERISAGRRADAYTRLAWLTETMTGLDATADLIANAQSCMDGLTDPRRQGWVHCYDSWYRLLAGDQVGSARLLTETRRCCAEAGDPPELVYGILDVAMVAAAMEGKVDQAEEQARQMVTVAREHGLDAVLPVALNALCEMALLRDAGDDVLRWAEEGLRHAEASASPDTYVWLLSQRGVAHLNRGELAAARRDLVLALELYVRDSLGVDGLEVVLRLAAVAARANQPDLAMVLAHAFDTAAAGTSISVSPVVQHVRTNHLSDLPRPRVPLTLAHGEPVTAGSPYLDVYRAVLRALAN